ncbi:MAG: hypothetical protein JRM95_03870 [Nitrososphaerota archaeon]|nr:hypothetical protein [Nitrososphaerota archaeon]
MAEADFFSSNGERVALTVIRKEASQAFGRDFVSGGFKDFFNKFKEGYWVEAKCAVGPSNMEQVMRDAIRDTLGSGAIVMEEAYASHQVMGAWEGRATISEEDLLELLGKRVQGSKIIRDEERAKKRATWKLTTSYGRDALVVVKEGNQEEEWARRKYRRIWEALAEKGFLYRTESGFIKKTVSYSLTQKGQDAIARRVSLDS